MTKGERLRLLAQHGLSPIFVISVDSVMVAITKTDLGYQAKLIGKNGPILATGYASEEAAVLAAALALELEGQDQRDCAMSEIRSRSVSEAPKF